MKMFLLILLPLILLSSNVFSANKYFYLKCLENIKTIRLSSTGFEKEGDLIGTIYVKVIPESKVTIHFSYEITKNKPHVIIENFSIKSEGLGFSLTDKFDDKEYKTFEYFKFIKIKNKYMFLRTHKWWSSKTKDYEESEIDYDSSGKCEKINKKKYNKFLKGT